MSDKKVFTFQGRELSVSWDERLCIHAAECGRAKGDLFVANREPWCDPDAASVEEAADVIGRCPSGALHITRPGEDVQKPYRENTIVVSCNGPLFIRGDLDIEGVPEDMPGVRSRVALCRCGESRNTPFCDTSHERIGFKDYGAVGETGKAVTAVGGKLHIKPLENGPLLITGNVVILSGSGRAAWHGDNAALCRCGHSQNKPFCDGSHEKAGKK
jgi:CDGSH-type Zn-finger protein/uncharacterized Fe-S cluster protein YjdI